MAEIKSYPNNVNEEIGAEHVMRWHHGRTSGVFGAPGELAVAALTTPVMAVTVTDGDGWLADQNGNGIHFWNDIFATTAALLQLSIDTADGVLSRIDRVIVEWSTPNYTQLPEIKILKGTNAVSPVAPALTNNASTRQISLAWISVAAGTLAITAGMIHDERFDASVCGVVTENVLVDSSVAVAQLNAVISQAQALINALTGEVVPNHANTHAEEGDDPVSPASIRASGKSVTFDATLLAAGWGADCLNLYNEAWSQGSLNNSTGVEESSSNHIRSTGYTSVTAGTTYSYADSIGAGARIFWYTASAFMSHIDVAQNGTVTAPATATRARIRLYSASAIVPADARWTMFNSGATIQEWEPQGKGIHVKSTDYSELATITALTAIEAIAPLSKNATSTQIEALQAANLFDGTQVGATEIVLHARGDVPTIDIPVRIIVRGDLY